MLQVVIFIVITLISKANGEDCTCLDYKAIKRTTEGIKDLVTDPPSLADDATAFVENVKNLSSMLDKYKRDCLLIKSKIKRLQKKLKDAVSAVDDWGEEPSKSLKRKMKSSLKKVLRLAKSLLKMVDEELVICESEPVETTTPAETAEVQPGQPPNIIMVMFNSLGYSDVGFHNEHMTTPTLDRLAKSAVLLDNYYVQPRSAHTKANIMIGMSHVHTGQQGIIELSKAHCMPCNKTTVAERLREANYSTHLVGQWHLGFYTKDCLPQNRGFDTFFGTYGGNDMDHFEHITCRCSSNKLQDRECRLKWCGLDLHNTDGSPAWDAQGTYSTTLFRDKSVEIIKTQPRNKPFFLMTSFTAPAGIPPPFVDGFEMMQKVSLKYASGSRAVYGGMVTAIDSAIQDILDALSERGIQNNTVVIITNDRGGSEKTNIDNLSFSWPLRGSKPRYWEGGIWGLGLVTAPWIPANVSNGLIHSTDWYPTMLSIAGVKTDDLGDIDGLDVWEHIRTGAASPRTEILHNMRLNVDKPLGVAKYNGTWNTSLHAIFRMGDFKILTGKNDQDEWKKPPEIDPVVVKERPDEPDDKNLWLFDIANDPYERNDISDTNEPQVLEMLDRMLELSKYYVGPSQFLKEESSGFGGESRNIWEPWVNETCSNRSIVFENL